MWCDNCCLLFPLRAGGIVWASLIVLYSFAYAIVLTNVGKYFYLPLEASVFGNTIFITAVIAMFAATALAMRSYLMTRIARILFYIPIILAIARLVLMVQQLRKRESIIEMNCPRNSPLGMGAPAGTLDVASPTPAKFCSIGFPSLQAVIAIANIIDLVCEAYMAFLLQRHKTRMEHYKLGGAGTTGRTMTSGGYTV